MSGLEAKRTFFVDKFNSARPLGKAPYLKQSCLKLQPEHFPFVKSPAIAGWKGCLGTLEVNG